MTDSEFRKHRVGLQDPWRHRGKCYQGDTQSQMGIRIPRANEVTEKMLLDLFILIVTIECLDILH